MATLNFNSTTPAAPSGYTNVTFASDAYNNISASFPTPVAGASLAGNNTFTGTNIFNANVGMGSATPRQQLSVGASMDIYTASAANSPTVPSIRSNGTGSGAASLYLNAYGAGAVSLNYDSGTGGVIFYNGAGVQGASVSAAGVGSFYGLAVAGSQATVRGIANPGALTLTTSGTAGTTSYSYAITAIQADGTTTAANPNLASSTIATGNATLSATNYIKISWTAVANAASYNVYRLTSGGTPSSIGKIASAITATTLNDTGLTGDGTTLATVRSIFNTTGLNLTSPIAGNMGGWITYLPTFTPSTGSISGLTVTDAQYLVVGPLCYLKVFVTMSFSAASYYALGSLPVPVVGGTPGTVLTALNLQYATVSAGTYSCGPSWANYSTTTNFSLAPAGGAQFSAVAYNMAISGIYRVL